MDDVKIVELLFERNDTALKEISDKYCRLYKGIIRGVLGDECDVEECSNDLLLAVWNTIPPNRPESLCAYICKIARRIGIDRLRHNTRQKRNTEYTLSLSELNDCLPVKSTSLDDTEKDSEKIALTLTEFLKGLDAETRILFVRRYLYLESVTDLSKRFEIEENRISVKLYRARKKLKKILVKEEIII